MQLGYSVPIFWIEKMRKPIKRRSKYFAPQNENLHRQCEHEGCCEQGEYRAPKDRSLKEYYWFCLKHVQEYNAKWNFYEGLDGGPEEENEKFRRFRFSSKIKYNFGFDFNGNFEFIDEYNPKLSPMTEVRFTAQERQCLRILEIDIEDLTLAVLKKSYKICAKKYHPDINQNNPEAEEKFKLISTAYKSIINKLS